MSERTAPGYTPEHTGTAPVTIGSALRKIGLNQSCIEDVGAVLDASEVNGEKTESISYVVKFVNDYLEYEEIHQLVFGIELCEQEKYMLILLVAKLVTLLPS